MNQSKLDKIKKEFEEKVNELRREIISYDGGESPVHDFGYKLRRGNEMFTVTDFGNIFSWFSQKLQEVEKEAKVEGTEEFFEYIRYRKGEVREPNDINKPCHDCGAINGELHKDGCDAEMCEFCGNQRISCWCDTSERIQKKFRQFKSQLNSSEGKEDK